MADAPELNPDQNSESELQESTDQTDEAKAEGQKDSGEDKGEEKKQNRRKSDQKIAQLNNDVSILTNKPLEQYKNGPIEVFEAQGKGSVPQNLVAYLCDEQYSPRINATTNYSKILNPHLTRLVASGVVYWPPDDRRRYVLVYEDNLGSPLVTDDINGMYGMEQDMVLEKIIRPLVGVLLDLRDKDLVHGAIKPSNIFNGGSTSLDRVVLGDCLSMPAWSNIPALYLPVDKAMADPMARGKGTNADDLYAFGVSLCVLLRENNPLENASDESIIARKIQQGSYLALTGKDRFTGGILELLRGLLFDDSVQRWTIDEVQAWLDGRRLSPKQSSKKAKASRPLMLMGKKYIYPEVLAMDMPKNVAEAAHVIENDELDQWLKRAVEDKPLTERVEKARQMAEDKGKSGSFQNKLVTRVSIALHPTSPIRYKGLKILPEGAGTALTHAYINKKDVQSFVDIFLEYYAMQWIDMYDAGNIDSGSLISKFDSCRAFLRQTGIGFGIERCIYYLDPCVPCLSEKIFQYHVRSPEDIMDAYEDLSGKPDHPVYFIDRHIAAFLSIKDRTNIDPYLIDLGAKEEHDRVLAELRILATIQKRSQLGNFPGIAGWVSKNLDVVYKRFHDRTLREDVKQKVAKLVSKGDLKGMAALFDNAKLYSNDSSSFFRAIHEYVTLKNEKTVLEHKLKNQNTYGLEAGRQVAAILSCVLALLVILGSTFMALSKVFGG